MTINTSEQYNDILEDSEKCQDPGRAEFPSLRSDNGVYYSMVWYGIV